MNFFKGHANEFRACQCQKILPFAKADPKADSAREAHLVVKVIQVEPSLASEESPCLCMTHLKLKKLSECTL